MDSRRTSFFRIFLLSLLLLLPMATAFAEQPDISCDKQSFDFMTGRYLLDGHVRVASKGRVVTADHAQGSFITEEVWAQGDVTLTQDGLLFRGDALYVDAKSHTAHLKDNILFERDNLTIKADDVVFNWDTKIAECTGSVTRILAGEKKTLSRLVYNVSTGEITQEEP